MTLPYRNKDLALSDDGYEEIGITDNHEQSEKEEGHFKDNIFALRQILGELGDWYVPSDYERKSESIVIPETVSIDEIEIQISKMQINIDARVLTYNIMLEQLIYQSDEAQKGTGVSLDDIRKMFATVVLKKKAVVSSIKEISSLESERDAWQAILDKKLLEKAGCKDWESVVQKQRDLIHEARIRDPKLFVSPVEWAKTYAKSLLSGNILKQKEELRKIREEVQSISEIEKRSQVKRSGQIMRSTYELSNALQKIHEYAVEIIDSAVERLIGDDVAHIEKNGLQALSAETMVAVRQDIIHKSWDSSVAMVGSRLYNSESIIAHATKIFEQAMQKGDEVLAKNAFSVLGCADYWPSGALDIIEHTGVAAKNIKFIEQINAVNVKFKAIEEIMTYETKTKIEEMLKPYNEIAYEAGDLEKVPIGEWVMIKSNVLFQQECGAHGIQVLSSALTRHGLLRALRGGDDGKSAAKELILMPTVETLPALLLYRNSMSPQAIEQLQNYLSTLSVEDKIVIEAQGKEFKALVDFVLQHPGTVGSMMKNLDIDTSQEQYIKDPWYDEFEKLNLALLKKMYHQTTDEEAGDFLLRSISGRIEGNELDALIQEEIFKAKNLERLKLLFDLATRYGNENLSPHILNCFIDTADGAREDQARIHEWIIDKIPQIVNGYGKQGKLNEIPIKKVAILLGVSIDGVRSDHVPSIWELLLSASKNIHHSDVIKIFLINNIERIMLYYNAENKQRDIPVKEIATLLGIVTTDKQIEGLYEIIIEKIFTITSRASFERAVILANIDSIKRKEYIAVLLDIEQSPSREIQRLKESLIDQIIKTEHPRDTYAKIEAVFVKNNLPTVGKVFKIFSLLYSGKTLEKIIGPNSSPTLQHVGSRRRTAILFADLLRAHIESGNRSLRDYLKILIDGETLIEHVEQGDEGGLSSQERKKLVYVFAKLQVLLQNSNLPIEKRDQVEMVKQQEKLLEEPGGLAMGMANLRESFGVEPGQTIKARIEEMFLRPVGLGTLEDVVMRMKKSKQDADHRGRALEQELSGQLMTLKAGDLIKGVDAKFIENILQNGSVAKEFLGASSGSDLTPLDTDLSEVLKEDEGMLANTISQSLARDYGDLFLILKNNSEEAIIKGENRFIHTVTTGNKAMDFSKLELFTTGVMGGKHVGIRTGFGSTQIDCIVAKGRLIQEPQEFEKICYEIAKGGFYIPVFDESGKLIFSSAEYDKYREIFSGIDEFDGPPFKYKPTDVGDATYSGVEQSKEFIAKEHGQIEKSRVQIIEAIRKMLTSNSIVLKDPLDRGLLGAELHDTGSTSRGTNLPDNYDFDLAVRLDAKDSARAIELADKFKKRFKFTVDNSQGDSSNNKTYQVRLAGVTEIDGAETKIPIDIDCLFASRSELSVFTSHEAIQDKLEWAEVHYGIEAKKDIVANVVFAKKVLKDAGAYKKPDGGFGGIGVENWILANQGNAQIAFREFWSAAHEGGVRLSLDEFKKRYHIFDAGFNIKFEKYDNYVELLQGNAYEKILGAIEKYL